MSAANLVKGCPLFHEIYDDEVEEVLAGCLVASYDPGQYIMKQGDSSTDICVLLSGDADVVVSKNGTDHHITTIGIGDLFGELVLINETQRTASIVANTKCDVLIMTYENFFSYYQKKPKVFALMVLNVTRLITKRLRSSNQVIENLNLKIAQMSKDSSNEAA